jgi:putative transposase
MEELAGTPRETRAIRACETLACSLVRRRSDYCVAVLEEALAHYGCPEIVNTDQGSQFTSVEFLNVLRQRQMQISMDGQGCWRDNVFVERLWRSVKYEEPLLEYL